VHTKLPKGQRSTDPADFPKEKSAYAMRDIDFFVREATKLGPSAGQFVQELLSGSLPWTKLRQAQQILSLAKKYGAARTDSACRTALAFEIDSSVRVKRILEKGMEIAHLPTPPTAQVIHLPLRFERSAKSFSHSPNQGDHDE